MRRRRRLPWRGQWGRRCSRNGSRQARDALRHWLHQPGELGEVELGPVATEAEGGLVIGPGSGLSRVERPKPHPGGFVRVPYLRCPFAPRPLPHSPVLSPPLPALALRRRRLGRCQWHCRCNSGGCGGGRRWHNGLGFFRTDRRRRLGFLRRATAEIAVNPITPRDRLQQLVTRRGRALLLASPLLPDPATRTRVPEARRTG